MSRGGALPRIALLGTALAGGVLWAGCFGREPLTLAPWIALAPLMVLLGSGRPAAAGAAYGLAFWAVSISWLAPNLIDNGGLAPAIAWAVVLGFSGVLALPYLAFGFFGARLWRLPAPAAVASLAALWVALEWVREFLFTGFPWNVAAFAWIEMPGALPTAAWVGAYGVSFLVVAANAAVARAVIERRPAIALWVVGLCLVTLALGGRWAAPSALRAPGKSGLAVRVIQPDIGIFTSGDARQVEAGYRRLLRLSRQACDEPGALLVWPESASWPLTWGEDRRLRQDILALAAAGCPVLFNTPTGETGWDHNSALLVDAEGVRGRYDKRHLVPFGEYVPRPFKLLPFVGKLARHVGDFTPGTDSALLDAGGERLAVSICYEVIFPSEVAEAVREGATVLVTITNDAWYGDTAAPRQHLRAARFRAAESRRPLLRAATTGISAIVGPDGAVHSHLEVGARGVLSGHVAGRRRLSPATRWPWLVPLACSLGAGFAILLARRRGTR